MIDWEVWAWIMWFNWNYLSLSLGMWSYLHRTFLAHLVLFQFYLQYPNILQFSHYNSLFITAMPLLLAFYFPLTCNRSHIYLCFFSLCLFFEVSPSAFSINVSILFAFFVFLSNSTLLKVFCLCWLPMFVLSHLN